MHSGQENDLNTCRMWPPCWARRNIYKHLVGTCVAGVENSSWKWNVPPVSIEEKSSTFGNFQMKHCHQPTGPQGIKHLQTQLQKHQKYQEFSVDMYGETLHLDGPPVTCIIEENSTHSLLRTPFSIKYTKCKERKTCTKTRQKWSESAKEHNKP